MSIRIKFKDFGLTRIRSELERMSRLRLTTGFQGASGKARHPNGQTVATIALYNEFGTRKTPQRSFMRSTIFEKRTQISDAIAREIQNVAFGLETSQGAMEDIGRFVVAQIEEKLARSREWARRNAPSTIARKGRNFPLHDLELMARSVTWSVRSKIGNTILSHGRSS